MAADSVSAAPRAATGFPVSPDIQGDIDSRLRVVLSCAACVTIALLTWVFYQPHMPEESPAAPPPYKAAVPSRRPPKNLRSVKSSTAPPATKASASASASAAASGSGGYASGTLCAARTITDPATRTLLAAAFRQINELQGVVGAQSELLTELQAQLAVAQAVRDADTQTEEVTAVELRSTASVRLSAVQTQVKLRAEAGAHGDAAAGDRGQSQPPPPPPQKSSRWVAPPVHVPERMAASSSSGDATTTPLKAPRRSYSSSAAAAQPVSPVFEKHTSPGSSGKKPPLDGGGDSGSRAAVEWLVCDGGVGGDDAREGVAEDAATPTKEPRRRRRWQQQQQQHGGGGGGGRSSDLSCRLDAGPRERRALAAMYLTASGGVAQ
jgi:hypothetical protein